MPDPGKFLTRLSPCDVALTSETRRLWFKCQPLRDQLDISPVFIYKLTVREFLRRFKP